jgi:pimeloyl-ACP methyl ester carboxylesterase
VTLAYDDQGSGPAAILLHSSVCDRRMWDPQWQLLLDAGYRVVRCDFRGHGETPAPTEPFNAADDVLALLDHLELPTATVIGSSYGGRVAQELAARWPSRVDTLLLLCAASRALTPTEAIQAFGRREDELLEAGDIDGATQLNVDTFVGPAASPEARAFVAEMQRRAFEIQLAAEDVAMVDADFDLSKITARTVVVSGDFDVDYFQSVADYLAASIPGALRVALPWAGHLPSIEDPEIANPLIMTWLGR